jgi:TonB family protein
MTNGLSIGGGVGGEQTLGLPPDFCCMPWAQQMVESISLFWNRNQPVKGAPVIKYTVHRDGSITDISVEQSSGNKYLDEDAQATLRRARIPALPAEYKQQTLTVSLKFLYGS